MDFRCRGHRACTLPGVAAGGAGAVASAVAKLPPSTLVLTLAMAQGPSSNSVAREHGVVFVAMT